MIVRFLGHCESCEADFVHQVGTRWNHGQAGPTLRFHQLLPGGAKYASNSIVSLKRQRKSPVRVCNE